jgi:hypothetical protein
VRTVAFSVLFDQSEVRGMYRAVAFLLGLLATAVAAVLQGAGPRLAIVPVAITAPLLAAAVGILQRSDVRPGELTRAPWTTQPELRWWERPGRAARRTRRRLRCMAHGHAIARLAGDGGHVCRRCGRTWASVPPS